MNDTISLFGMTIDRLSIEGATAQILSWCVAPRGDRCRYIVTPNVDHVVMFQQHPDLRTAYADASLVLADGAPVVWASRLLRQPLPERVAGSDLVPAVLAAAGQVDGGDCAPLRVFFLGAAPGVAEEAVRRLVARYPHVRFVGTYSPPLGFEHSMVENMLVLEQIANARPDLLVLGLGAPKQELWIQKHCRQVEAKVTVCAGATIDFLAGHRRRSPVWLRRIGLEWLHRMLREPRRLARRYVRDAFAFPPLVWREYRTRVGSSRIA
jgi:N-acetylglucosaminyldiphosphoundecaprenol N-acetyl-beta-D-mannosaminyltransferase